MANFSKYFIFLYFSSLQSITSLTSATTPSLETIAVSFRIFPNFEWDDRLADNGSDDLPTSQIYEDKKERKNINLR